MLKFLVYLQETGKQDILFIYFFLWEGCYERTDKICVGDNIEFILI